MKISDLQVISDLPILSGNFLLGYEETEYRKKGRATLHVYSNGTCRISVGSSSPNVHILNSTVSEMHKGKFKAPYFSYKYGTLFKSVKEAIDCFNEWKDKRSGNL